MPHPPAAARAPPPASPAALVVTFVTILPMSPEAFTARFAANYTAALARALSLPETAIELLVSAASTRVQAIVTPPPSRAGSVLVALGNLSATTEAASNALGVAVERVSAPVAAEAGTNATVLMALMAAAEEEAAATDNLLEDGVEAEEGLESFVDTGARIVGIGIGIFLGSLGVLYVGQCCLLSVCQRRRRRQMSLLLADQRSRQQLRSGRGSVGAAAGVKNSVEMMPSCLVEGRETTAMASI
jgi:hypothetical protein